MIGFQTRLLGKMVATAEDLPPEMLENIAEILSGKPIETFNDGADSNPLELVPWTLEDAKMS